MIVDELETPDVVHTPELSNTDIELTHKDVNNTELNHKDLEYGGTKRDHAGIVLGEAVNEYSGVVHGHKESEHSGIGHGHKGNEHSGIVHGDTKGNSENNAHVEAKMDSVGIVIKALAHVLPTQVIASLVPVPVDNMCTVHQPDQPGEGIAHMGYSNYINIYYYKASICNANIYINFLYSNY